MTVVKPTIEIVPLPRTVPALFVTYQDIKGVEKSVVLKMVRGQNSMSKYMKFEPMPEYGFLLNISFGEVPA